MLPWTAHVLGSDQSGTKNKMSCIWHVLTMGPNIKVYWYHISSRELVISAIYVFWNQAWPSGSKNVME